jgi:hypothetical protein
MKLITLTGSGSRAVLPDGIFFNQKNLTLGKFWSVLHISWPFGQFSGHMAYFMAL